MSHNSNTFTFIQLTRLVTLERAKILRPPVAAAALRLERCWHNLLTAASNSIFSYRAQIVYLGSLFLVIGPQKTLYFLARRNRATWDRLLRWDYFGVYHPAYSRLSVCVLNLVTVCAGSSLRPDVFLLW